MIKYINSQGKELPLISKGLAISEETLRNYRWAYSLVQSPSGRGGKFKRISMASKNETITIIARGTSKEECTKQLNNLQNIIEADIVNNTPGRLYIGNQYLSCFLGLSSTIKHMQQGYHYAKKEITVDSPNPLWITEEKQEFRAGNIEETVIADVKRFTLRYPFRYSSSYSNRVLFNSHFANTPIIITIYGPAVNPDITIAGHHYMVMAEILENERIVINQMENSIFKIDGSGLKFNLFNSRNKEGDIFRPIPEGESYVQHAGEWSFDIVMIQQRSEPLWN